MRREGALLLGLLLVSTVPALAAPPSTQEEIEARLMCYCGCANLSIRTCTCGTADAVRREIAGRLAEGESPEQVIGAFVARHGEQILAAPAKSGFNLLAWIAPFGAVLLGAAALVFVVRRWAGRAPLPAGAPSGSAAALSDEERAILERMDREIRKEL